MLWDLMFPNYHLNDFMLLECYILRKPVLETCILLEDFGLMTFCYTWEGFMSLEDFDFMKLV